MLISEQCGETIEWKPRGFIQILVILGMVWYAYFSRQLKERSSMHQLIAAARLHNRLFGILSSLLPPHVIPKLEQRAAQRGRRTSAVSLSAAGALAAGSGGFKPSALHDELSKTGSDAEESRGGLFALAEKHSSVIALHADVIGFTALYSVADPSLISSAFSCAPLVLSVSSNAEDLII